jgi:hypothetical protein
MSALFDGVLKLANGMTPEELAREYDETARVNAKDEGKCMGECESCGQLTCLVEEVGLCGPCCFGEADTLNGNW